MYKIFVDDEEIEIRLSRHSRKRMEQRVIDEHAVYGSILSLGDRLLDLKCGQEFAIVDRNDKEAVVGAITVEGENIVVDVITVIHTDHVYVKDGQKVFNIKKLK